MRSEDSGIRATCLGRCERGESGEFVSLGLFLKALALKFRVSRPVGLVRSRKHVTLACRRPTLGNPDPRGANYASD